MKVHFTLEEVLKRNAICKECEEHMTLWNPVTGYCLKHKTDSIVFLVEKCNKLEELK